MEAASPIAPRSGNGFIERVANRLLRMIGWRVVGTVPQVPKFVAIVAPHTSNWELPIGLVCGFASGFLRMWPYGFMMKNTVFRWPIGGLMSRIGGLPVDRSQPHEVVPQMVGVINQHDRFLLAITPEGTRKRTTHWKSGFYHIAHAAGVPIVPIYFDYAKRECGVGRAVYPTGDIAGDLDIFRRFFSPVTPKRPEKVGEIRFRETEPLSGRAQEGAI